MLFENFLEKRPYTTHQFDHHMVDVIAVLKGRFHNRTDPTSARNRMRMRQEREMGMRENLEGQDAAGLMALDAQTPAEDFTQRTHETQRRQQELRDNPPGMDAEKLRALLAAKNTNPGMAIKGEPFNKSWFVLKERLSNLRNVQPVIQQMIEGHVGNLERDRVENKRDEQGKLISGGGERAMEQHAGEPVGSDWPADKHVRSPTEAGLSEMDQPPFTDEEMWNTHHVPHHDRAPMGFETQEPQININPYMAMEDKEGNLLDARHANDRTERTQGDVQDPSFGLVHGQLEGILRHHLDLIDDAPNAEAKARRVKAMEDFRDGTMATMLASSKKRQKRAKKKAPWKPQPQLWDIGVDRNPDPKPEMDLQ